MSVLTSLLHCVEDFHPQQVEMRTAEHVSSPVILRCAQDLSADRARPFAALRVTGMLSKCLNLL